MSKWAEWADYRSRLFAKQASDWDPHRRKELRAKAKNSEVHQASYDQELAGYFIANALQDRLSSAHSVRRHIVHMRRHPPAASSEYDRERFLRWYDNQLSYVLSEMEGATEAGNAAAHRSTRPD